MVSWEGLISGCIRRVELALLGWPQRICTSWTSQTLSDRGGTGEEHMLKTLSCWTAFHILRMPFSALTPLGSTVDGSTAHGRCFV